MDSEQSAEIAALSKHKKFMFIGNKKRYIEVIQCSGEDMNMVLTNGVQPTPGVCLPGMPGIQGVPGVPGVPGLQGVPTIQPPPPIIPPHPSVRPPLVSPGKLIMQTLNIIDLVLHGYKGL